MDLRNSKNPTDFTKPNTVKIGNAVFRTFSTKEPLKIKAPGETITALKKDLISCPIDYEDHDDFNWDIDINITKTGKFITYLYVAPCLYTQLVETLKQNEIEKETNTRFKMPKCNEPTNIAIKGESEKEISSARIKLKKLILKIKALYEETYFVSVPVISFQIRGNFNIFKSNILNGPPMRGVDESTFISVNRLHLRIASFALLDIKEIEEAMKIMEDCKDEIILLFEGSWQLKIVLEGLEIMNDDPTKVDVLYGKVRLNTLFYRSRFQKMADIVADHFSRKGLTMKQKDGVKLHVALMDSWGREDDSKYNRPRRRTFDCSYILDKYKNFVFGKANFDDLHLSSRFSSDGKYYESVLSLRVA